MSQALFYSLTTQHWLAHTFGLRANYAHKFPLQCSQGIRRDFQRSPMQSWGN